MKQCLLSSNNKHNPQVPLSWHKKTAALGFFSSTAAATDDMFCVCLWSGTSKAIIDWCLCLSAAFLFNSLVIRAACRPRDCRVPQLGSSFYHGGMQPPPSSLPWAPLTCSPWQIAAFLPICRINTSLMWPDVLTPNHKMSVEFPASWFLKSRPSLINRGVPSNNRGVPGNITKLAF